MDRSGDQDRHRHGNGNPAAKRDLYPTRPSHVDPQLRQTRRNRGSHGHSDANGSANSATAVIVGLADHAAMVRSATVYPSGPRLAATVREVEVVVRT